MLLLCFLSLPSSSSIASTGGTPVSARRKQHHPAVFVGMIKQLLLARAGMFDVDGRKNPPVNEAAIQAHFHVARALEFFKDHLVHALNPCPRAPSQ